MSMKYAIQKIKLLEDQVRNLIDIIEYFGIKDDKKTKTSEKN